MIIKRQPAAGEIFLRLKLPPHFADPWGGVFSFPPIFRTPGGEVKKTFPPMQWGGIANPGKALCDDYRT